MRNDRNKAWGKNYGSVDDIGMSKTDFKCMSYLSKGGTLHLIKEEYAVILASHLPFLY